MGATGGRLIRLPGAGLLGPMALTVVLELTGLSFGLAVPMVLVQVGYMVIGWQAGLAFTRESLRAIGRMLPAAIGLIVALGVATAGLGALLAHVHRADPAGGLPRHQSRRCVRRARDRRRNRVQRDVHHRGAGGAHPC